MGNQLATRTNGNALAQMGYEREQIDLIKKTVAPDASDTELQLFLHTCKTRGLDPLLRQVYFIKRGGKGTIQVSIDGFRMKAAETRECAGIDDAEFEGTVAGKYPASARVTVYRLVQGHRCPFSATARWSEYVQEYNGKASGLWEKMPHTMLAKCAESLALRKAFPAELGGLYTNEEMTQAESPVRQVNTTTGEIIEPRTQVQSRRNSDPPAVVKHETLTGELIHEKTVDPATGSTAPIMRGEENEHFQPRTTAEDALNAKGLISHKGWMKARKLDPENKALSLWLLNRAAPDHPDHPDFEWTSRKQLPAEAWAHCNTALAKLTHSELTEWVQQFYAAIKAEEAGAEDDPFSGDDPALAPGYCFNCGSREGCECSDELKIKAYASMKAAEAQTGALLDVEPVASGNVGAFQ